MCLDNHFNVVEKVANLHLDYLGQTDLDDHFDALDNVDYLYQKDLDFYIIISLLLIIQIIEINDVT